MSIVLSVVVVRLSMQSVCYKICFSLCCIFVNLHSDPVFRDCYTTTMRSGIYVWRVYCCIEGNILDIGTVVMQCRNCIQVGINSAYVTFLPH